MHVAEHVDILRHKLNGCNNYRDMEDKSKQHLVIRQAFITTVQKVTHVLRSLTVV